MSEKETLIKMARRLEANKLIDDVRYPTDTNDELSYHSNGWHGYWTRFRFDDNGDVIETSAGC